MDSMVLLSFIDRFFLLGMWNKQTHTTSKDICYHCVAVYVVCVTLYMLLAVELFILDGECVSHSPFSSHPSRMFNGVLATGSNRLAIR